MLNKFIKLLCNLGVHILVALEVYLLALLIQSPLYCLALGIMDLFGFPLEVLKGKFLLTFIETGAVLWVFLYIYVRVKVFKEIKK